MPARADGALAARIGAWFDVAARDLPWRHTRDPYAIWVSEVMLQQTRVATVVAYYERFLARFPDVRALAAAEEDAVLGAWSGLGYYRRARQLHAGAREVVTRYGGELPRDSEGLRAIPGVGPYTAGAIASLAYGERAPLVDGNVARVYARLFGVGEDVRSSAGAKAIWALADRVLPAARPGRHNEALMELGATVCLPRAPRCDACPLASSCVARREGRQAELPVVGRTRAPTTVHLTALVARDTRERVLLGRRRDEGLFAGLWEPPMVEAVHGASKEGEGERALARALGSRRLAVVEVGQVRHVLTHRVLEVRIVSAASCRVGAPPADGAYAKLAWVAEDALAARGVSALARKVLALTLA